MRLVIIVGFILIASVLARIGNIIMIEDLYDRGVLALIIGVAFAMDMIEFFKR